MVLDSNLVTVALPSIRSDVDIAHQDLQWVVSGYSLAFGGALLPAARAVDVYGGRLLLRAGLATFSLALVGCALAPSPATLIGIRAAQGLGAAMALPSSLALLASSFAEGEARSRALGVYGLAVSGAFVAGVLLGGVLILKLGWRGALLCEAGLGAAATAATGRLLVGPRSGTPKRFALSGALAVAISASLVLYSVGDTARTGRGSLTGLLCLVCAVAAARWAWLRDIGSPVPLVPRALRAHKHIRTACVAAFLTVATGVGAMFVLTIYLQDIRDLSPAAAGGVLCLLGVAGILSALALPAFATRFGAVRALSGSLVVQALGVALTIPLGTGGGFGWILIGSAMLGAGHFAATVAFTTLATEGVSADDQGIAMGMLGSSQQLGGAFGLAVIVGAAAARPALLEGLRWALASAALMSLTAALLVWCRQDDRSATRA